MIFGTAGAKLYIGGVVTNPDKEFEVSDFADETWLRISETENLGSLGDVSREMEWKDTGRGRTIRVKGGSRSGTIMELICGLSVECPGQLALMEAEASIRNYKFRLVFNDAPPNGTPSERLFVAAVGNIVEDYSNDDEIVRFNAPLWVNSNLVRINAAAPA